MTFDSSRATSQTCLVGLVGLVKAVANNFPAIHLANSCQCKALSIDFFGLMAGLTD